LLRLRLKKAIGLIENLREDQDLLSQLMEQIIAIRRTLGAPQEGYHIRNIDFLSALERRGFLLGF
jgi:hypothetical protein